MSRARKKAASRSQGQAAQSDEPMAGKPAGRRYLKRVLIAVAVLGVVALVAWLARVRSHPPVEPEHPETVSPELADYLPRFIQAVRDKPESAEAHANLGLVYEANEMWPEARKCFENAADLDRKEPLASYHAGLAAIEMKDDAGAELALRQATKRARTFAPAHHRLGLFYLDAGDLVRAAPELDRAFGLAPGEVVTRIALGDLKLRQKDYAGAATILEEAAKQAPTNGTVRHLLGTAYKELGRAEDADRQFKRAKSAGARFMVDEWSKKLPAHAMSLPRQMARATAFLNAGRPAEAASILENALQWHPDNPDLLNNLAIAKMNAGELDKAGVYLGRSLAANPTHALTHVNMAALAARRGDLEGALASATHAVELAPDIAETHRKRAALLLQLHRPEEALAEALRTRDLDPESGSSHLGLARAYTDLGRGPEAITEFRAAIDADPTLPGAYVGLVEALVAAGDRGGAREALDAATKALPKHPQIRDLATRHPDLAPGQK
jgi:tetratricopeptide (TPR) repeat protein